MPFYEYRAPDGCVWDKLRPASERDQAIACSHGAEGRRVYSWEGLVTHIPRRFFTSHEEVHGKSEREMARDPNVERYNPSQWHEPTLPKPDLRPAFEEALRTHGRPDGAAA